MNYSITEKNANKILDKCNHHMDAIRYALESHMKNQIIDYNDLL